MNRKTFFSLALSLVFVLSSCAPTAQNTPIPTAVPVTSVTDTAIPLQEASPVPGAFPTAAEATATVVPPSAATPKHIVGYYAQWATERGFPPANIQGDKLTQINYAFGNVSAQGECQVGDPKADVERVFSSAESVSGAADSTDAKALHGNFNQLLELKQKYPNLQILISVGGWTWSEHFSAAAATDASRKAFVTSCINVFLKQYPGLFDGIDIDWEFPVSGGLKPGTPDDKHNYTLMLAELRAQLEALGATDGKHYLLSIAAPASPGVAQNLERSEIIKSLDWINLMTYDIHGVWEKSTNFNAPLYKSDQDPGDASSTVDASVQGYLAAGVPASQLVMGVPFYGHGWQGVPNQDHGLYQPATGGAPGIYEDGAFDYKELKDHYFATYIRGWNADAQSPWLYSPITGIFIGYDDHESIAAKAGYAKDQGLGGVMVWELSQDDNGLLLGAIQKGFKEGGISHAVPTPDLEALSRPRPFTQEIHGVSGIKIDADLSDWPADPTFTLNDKSQIVFLASPDKWSGPEDFSAKAWVGWAPEGLYMAFKVLDDKIVQKTADANLWHGDYMELQLDTQLEKDYVSAEMNDDDYQIGISTGDFASVPPAFIAWFGPMTTPLIKAVQRAQVKTADGYIMEIFFPKDTFPGIQFQEGGTFGMNINPSDSDGTDQEVMFSTSLKRTLSDPRTFGKIVMVK